MAVCFCADRLRRLQFKEYLERAEYLKKCISERQEEAHAAQNGVGPTQKSKPGGGGGGKDEVSIL